MGGMGWRVCRGIGKWGSGGRERGQGAGAAKSLQEQRWKQKVSVGGRGVEVKDGEQPLCSQEEGMAVYFCSDEFLTDSLPPSLCLSLAPLHFYFPTQMTQQMSGMNVSGGGPAPATLSQSGAPAAGWPAASPAASGQTLSTQLWKWREEAPGWLGGRNGNNEKKINKKRPATHLLSINNAQRG